MSLRNLEAVTKVFPITRLQSTLMLIDSGLKAVLHLRTTDATALCDGHLFTQKNRNRKKIKQKKTLFLQLFALLVKTRSVQYQSRKKTSFDTYFHLIYPPELEPRYQC